MTAIERAARALCKMDGSPEKSRDTKPAMRMTEGELDWERYVPQVRAVLAAIREPSVDMTICGGNVRTRTDVPAGSGDIWRAMIDAALAEIPT